jgi:hypothetical protein
MKDQRLNVFRIAVDALVESLDALVRVSRWTGADAPPDPLRTAVSKLMDRLGTANRLAAGSFAGTPADANKVTAICTAMKRLDVAYVAYRKRILSSPEQVVDAATALEVEISEATGAARSWA